MTSVQEIRDFIAKNKHEKDHQEKVDQIGTSMQYRAGWEDQLSDRMMKLKKVI